ncbi:MAG TPA: hypothetical protein VFH83_05870 [Spirochaetia bacterium]|nr:hypothetical protein [Spirochaetia bacterium]
MLLTAMLIVAAAGAFGQDLRISAGLDAGFVPTVYENQTVADSAGTCFPAGTQLREDYSYSAARMGAFVDLTHGILSVAYRTSVTPLNASISVLGQTASGQAALSLSALETRALVKIPFQMVGLTVLVLAGPEYTACLSGSIGGIALDDASKQDLSDFSLVGGFGVDLVSGEKWFLRSSVMAGYSLTSKRSSQYYAGVAYVSSSRWRLEIDLGAGWLVVGRNAAERH